MAELENEDLDLSTDNDEQLDTGTDDFQDEDSELLAKYKIDLDNVTTDDFKAMLKRLNKAEKKRIEIKKQEKQEKQVSGLTVQDLELREELSDFLIDNPELREYKSELLKYRKEGFNFRQAKALVENDDKTIENRKKLASANITTGESGGNKNSYTQEELARLPLEQRAKIYEKVQSGKVVIK